MAIAANALRLIELDTQSKDGPYISAPRWSALTRGRVGRVRRTSMTGIKSSPLYQQIIENPHDRELRLVFADWLEEEGDVRGQVVRMQCQLEDMQPGDRGYSTLRAKERKLYKQYGGFGHIGFASKQEHKAGFVEWIEITPTRLLKHAEEIFKTAPIRELRLKGKSKKFDKLAKLPQLQQVRSLALKQSKIDDAALTAVVESPNLANLETFELHSDDALSIGSIVGRSALIENLKCLRLTSGNLNDQDVARLVERPQLTSLQVGYALTDGSFQRIGEAGALRSLASLVVSQGWNATGFSADGLESFGNSDFDEPLQELTLRPVDRGFGAALAAPRLRELRRLDISWTHVATEDVVSMTEHLGQLEELRLTETRLRDAAARALARSPILQNLKKVYLTGNQITVKGVEAILDSEFFSPKTEFHLSGNSLKATDITAIRARAGKSFGNMSREVAWRPWM